MNDGNPISEVESRVLDQAALLDLLLEDVKSFPGSDTLCVNDFTDTFGDYQFGASPYN